MGSTGHGMRYGLNNTTEVILLTAVVSDIGFEKIIYLNIHITYNCINIHVKYAIVSQFLKSFTLQLDVIYHRMDDILQCLFNLYIK